MTDQPIPAEALDAANAAQADWVRNPAAFGDDERGGQRGTVPQRQLRIILEAAAPHILAAVPRLVVIQDEVSVAQLKARIAALEAAAHALRADLVARIAARLRKHATGCYPIDRFPPLSADPHEAEGAASRLAYENAALIAEEFTNHD